ncbi:MAG: hypothetical protein IPK32_18285 [Verrucomicrobiaceae bacterium]|nr:hypothetical protein [Verrucomicrobiaceae bacterium]
MLRLSLAACLCLPLSSCLYLRTTSQTYEATQAAPEVGGARFRAEFIPRGSNAPFSFSAMAIGGAAVTENGPYQLRLHAFGQEGRHQWFRVTRFVLSVPGRMTAPMEKRGFDGQSTFAPTTNKGISRASLVFGTNININNEHKDKEVLIDADVEVMRSGRLVRGTLSIPMKMAKASRNENFLLPVEIVKSFKSESLDDLPPAMPPPPESADVIKN